jgi:hypothetical protein
VAYLLDARTVESEKQLLLANGSETFVVKQWLCKHIPAATDKHTTIDVILETVFSTRFVQRGSKEDNRSNCVSFVREAVEKGLESEAEE